MIQILSLLFDSHCAPTSLACKLSNSAAAGALECNYAIKYGADQLVSLSIQQILDCAVNAGNGCNGGDPGFAMQYAANQGGLCLDANYPYTKGEWGLTGSCRQDSCGEKYDKCRDVKRVVTDSATALKQALQTGCVTVGVNGEADAFQHYSSGVFDGKCNSSLNHGMLVVGYGTDDEGNKYWNLRNSFGTNWGENGYIRICRECHKNGKQGQCGILNYPTIPLF